MTKPAKLHAAARRQINGYLNSIGRVYHHAIPLGQIIEVIEAHAARRVVQEDGTPWSGFLCGREGRATLEIENTREALQLSWYKLESGRYEVTAYVA